jgi:hypothetical protein
MAYVVRGKNGKVVGTYATRGEAERRIAQLKAGAERLRRFQFAGGRRAASPVNPLGEYAAHQRRMKTFVAQKYGGTREYVHNSAIPSGAGRWLFWTKPAGGGKARQEYATHAEVAGSRHESSPSPARIYGPLSQAQQLVYDHRVSNPRSRAVSILRFVKNTSATKQRGCVLCGETGPSWAGNYPETKRAREWANAHIASHLGQHSWPGQPRRHAKAARLGHRRAQRSPDEFPRVSTSWGEMPPFADFAARVGNSYPIEAHANSVEGKLLRRLRVQPSGVGKYGKNRYVLSPKQLYGLVNRLSDMDPDAGEGFASSIMETLGYEWI